MADAGPRLGRGELARGERMRSPLKGRATSQRRTATTTPGHLIRRYRTVATKVITEVPDAVGPFPVS
jgi:hypothetical protein